MWPYGQQPQQPFIIIPQAPPVSPGTDPIDQMERTVKFMKRMRDEDKDEFKKDKDKDKKDEKKGLTFTEWLMLTLAASSIVNTLVVLWMVRGK